METLFSISPELIAHLAKQHANPSNLTKSDAENILSVLSDIYCNKKGDDYQPEPLKPLMYHLLHFMSNNSASRNKDAQTQKLLDDIHEMVNLNLKISDRLSKQSGTNDDNDDEKSTPKRPQIYIQRDQNDPLYTVEVKDGDKDTTKFAENFTKIIKEMNDRTSEILQKLDKMSDSNRNRARALIKKAELLFERWIKDMSRHKFDEQKLEEGRILLNEIENFRESWFDRKIVDITHAISDSKPDRKTVISIFLTICWLSVAALACGHKFYGVSGNTISKIFFPDVVSDGLNVVNNGVHYGFTFLKERIDDFTPVLYCLWNLIGAPQSISWIVGIVIKYMLKPASVMVLLPLLVYQFPSMTLFWIIFQLYGRMHYFTYWTSIKSFLPKNWADVTELFVDHGTWTLMGYGVPAQILLSLLKGSFYNSSFPVFFIIFIMLKSLSPMISDYLSRKVQTITNTRVFYDITTSDSRSTRLFTEFGSKFEEALNKFGDKEYNESSKWFSKMGSRYPDIRSFVIKLREQNSQSLFSGYEHDPNQVQLPKLLSLTDQLNSKALSVFVEKHKNQQMSTLSPDALNAIGMYYIMISEDDERIDQGLKFLIAAGETGHAGAMRTLAQLYEARGMHKESNMWNDEATSMGLEVNVHLRKTKRKFYPPAILKSLEERLSKMKDKNKLSHIIQGIIGFAIDGHIEYEKMITADATIEKQRQGILDMIRIEGAGLEMSQVKELYSDGEQLWVGESVLEYLEEWGKRFVRLNEVKAQDLTRELENSPNTRRNVLHRLKLDHDTQNEALSKYMVLERYLVEYARSNRLTASNIIKYYEAEAEQGAQLAAENEATQQTSEYPILGSEPRRDPRADPPNLD